MRFVIVVLFAACIVYLMYGPEIGGSLSSRHVADYYGHYRGIGPLGDGTNGYGEMDVVVEKSGITARLATRYGEKRSTIEYKALIPMTPMELKRLYPGLSDEVKAKGLRPKIGAKGSERLIFFANQEGSEPALVAYDVADINDSGVYWTDEQVAAGAMKTFLSQMPKSNEVPRLSD